MSNTNEDIVRDILGRLQAAFIEGKPLSDPEFWADQEASIRAQWGGDRPYISKTGRCFDEIVGPTIQRDREICQAYLRDKISASALATKYGLSRIRIYQIVRGEA